MTQIAVEITGDDRKAAQAFARLQAKVQELESKLKTAGAGGRKAGDDLSRSFNQAAREIGNVVGGFLTLQGGIDAVTRSIATYVRNMEEASEAGEKFARQSRAFAFEAGPGGRAQLAQFMQIAAAHGVEDRGAAIELADTLGDMLQDKTAARREFAEMLKLTAAGVGVAELPEIAVGAAARGLDPGLIGRELVETAARTGISPATLPRFMRGMELLPSMEEGMVTAAFLQQRLGERKTQAGFTSIAQLMGTGAPKEFQATLAGLGVGKDADFTTRMNALAAAGIDSVEEVIAAGVKELSTAQPLAIALQRRGDILRMAEGLPREATEQRLAERIAAMEAENPEIRLARQNATLRATQANAEAFGTLAVEGMLEERERLKQGAAFRGAGVEQFGPFDVTDEKGRATTFTRGMAAVVGEPEVVQRQREVVENFLEKADRMFSNLEAATRNLEKAGRNLRGGPALVPATDDQ